VIITPETLLVDVQLLGGWSFVTVPFSALRPGDIFAALPPQETMNEIDTGLTPDNIKFKHIGGVTPLLKMELYQLTGAEGVVDDPNMQVGKLIYVGGKEPLVDTLPND